MRLLEPKEVNSNKQQEETRLMVRIQELRDLEKEARSSIVRAEVDFKATLTRQQKVWDLAMAEYIGSAKKVRHDLELAENERDQALIPVETLKNHIRKALITAREYLATATKKKQDNEERETLLQDKLSDVNAKDIELSELERQLLARKKGIEEQAKQVQMGVRDLNKSMKDFEVYRFTEQRAIKDQKEDLALERIAIEAQRDKTKKTNERLSAWEKRLEDREQSLKLAYEELKTKSP